MSPILVRPVREQLEHDRIIRLLQPKYKRRFVTAINPGAETNQAVGDGPDAFYPDVVVYAIGRTKKPVGIIEVETQESINALEAKAQWVVYGRLPIEFWLYVPAVSVEVVKRLCHDNHVGVTEIWTYHAVGDQVRFTLVHRAPVEAKISAARAAAAAAAAGRREAERIELAARRAAARKAVRKPQAAKATPAKARAAGKQPAARKATRVTTPATRAGASRKR